jgi:hypothetical protein
VAWHWWRIPYAPRIGQNGAPPIAFFPLVHQQAFSGAVAGEEEDFCKGSLSCTIFYFVFCFALFYFCLHLFIKNTKKISFFIVLLLICFLVLLE